MASAEEIASMQVLSGVVYRPVTLSIREARLTDPAWASFHETNQAGNLRLLAQTSTHYYVYGLRQAEPLRDLQVYEVSKSEVAIARVSAPSGVRIQR